MTQPKRILALDLGTTCGYALTFSQGGFTSGFENFKPKNHESHGKRYLNFKTFLESTIITNDWCVFYEMVHSHAGTDAAHMFGGYMATLQSFCEEREISYQGVAVGTIKKGITGKGTASKDEVKEAVSRIIGTKKDNDNEADAIAVLNIALKITQNMTLEEYMKQYENLPKVYEFPKEHYFKMMNKELKELNGKELETAEKELEEFVTRTTGLLNVKIKLL